MLHTLYKIQRDSFLTLCSLLYRSCILIRSRTLSRVFFILVAVYALAAAVFVGLYYFHPYPIDRWLSFPELF